MQRRPAGITALVVLIILSVILFVFQGITFISLSGQAVDTGGAPFPIFGIVSLVLATVLLAAALGLSQLNGWGWLLTLAGAVVGVASLVALWMVDPGVLGGRVLALVVNVIIIACLFIPAVREATGRR